MSKISKKQSTSMHQKVRISSVRRGKKIEQLRSSVVHFATEPMSDGRMFLSAMKSDTIEQEDIMQQNKKVSGSETKSKTMQNETAKQLKEREIKKAFDTTHRKTASARKRIKKYPQSEFGFKKLALALACTAVIVLGVVYLVNANSPDASIKVAAMQNGINAIYPKYIPRGYGENPVGITSENGKITINYKNSETGDSFSIIEEVSEWNNEEFYENCIKNEPNIDYSRVDESGMTIYVNGNMGAVWMDGNVLIRLKVTSGTLTKKQMVTIATKK